MKIDHIYCINLERSKTRRANMEAHFKEFPIYIEFFKGVDGEEFGRDGVWGCAQSHIAVWKDIIDKGYKNALILEDDIKLHPKFNEILATMIPPNGDWDILYLFGLLPIYEGESDSPHFYKARSLSTAAYIVSERFSNRFKDITPEYMKCPIDEFLALEVKLDAYMNNQNLISLNMESAIDSSIGISLTRLTPTTLIYLLHKFKMQLIIIVVILTLWLITNK